LLGNQEREVVVRSLSPQLSLASIQEDKGKPSAKGRVFSPNLAVLIVNPNINQLLSEHDLVTLVVKTLTKSPDNTGKYL
jgi:hypothetical protein